MIKFFRKLRFKSMEQNKTGKYIKYAIGEIILVVIGILIALQINNWNEAWKETKQETVILKSLQNNIKSDIHNLSRSITFQNSMVKDYTNCLNILAEKKEATKTEFLKSFATILQVGGVVLNTTTFNNLQNNGELKLIKNKTIADSIVGYYNTNYMGWEASLKDYTRNNFAPYLLEFDYIPQINLKNLDEELVAYNEELPDNITDFKKSEKPLKS